MPTKEATLTKTTSFQTFESLWDDAVADELDPVDRLVYRSNLLGVDSRITNTGGGNTSSKIMEEDPVTGERVEVLWVKGSGGDLRTAKRENFASLYQDQLLALQDVYQQFDDRGPKTDAEDAMVGMYPHTTFNLNPRAPSIDTPLHSFVPYKHVDHTHPVSVISIATAENGPELTKEIYGDDVIWIDWLRPGFELGLALQQAVEENPQARGIILGGHGLINWADDDKECYLLSLELINKAAEYLSERDKGADTFGGQKYEALSAEEREELLFDLLPWLRGRVSHPKRVIGTVEFDDSVLRFVNSDDAGRLAELGTSCPDHFLRTKIKPLFVDWDPSGETLEDLKSKLEAGLEQYQQDYADYYEQHKHPDSPAMRASSPSVILIPGVGMIAWGKSKSESRVTAEFYKAAIGVMRGAETVSEYVTLPKREAFDIEYWQLEEAKLKRMPPEAEMARQIVAVIGGGHGIGRSATERLIQEGAVAAVVDLDEEAAEEVAQDIEERVGTGIGVAGTGISSCGDVIASRCDITDRQSVRDVLKNIIFAYGGLDHVIVTAGLYAEPNEDGLVPDEMWAASFAVNVTGPYIVADEMESIWVSQDLKGSMVLTTSVNAVVSKAGSFAYDTSKAAANHLVRELAVFLAPRVRVNGVAPATVVEGSTMFPRDRVIASLAKYDLPYDGNEDTETLRQRLAEFYTKRSLIGETISPEDQAEAIFLLASERMNRTTGQIINVDGGLKDGFLR